MKRSSSLSLTQKRQEVSYFQFEAEDTKNITISRQNPKQLVINNETVLQYASFFPRIIDKVIITKELTIIGCCLLVDISGFTKLSSKLCLEGPTGIDSLRVILDHSFANFVSIIHQYGGDVIEFAGDSLLCVFLPESDEGSKLIECCNRVIQCGLKLSKCHIDETTIHVGITFGSISFALLGGYNNRYSLLMNGRCVDEIGLCLDHANSEEVVITRELLEQAGLADYNFISIGEFPLPLSSYHTLNDFENPDNKCTIECIKIITKKKLRILTGLSHQITPSLQESEKNNFVLKPIHYEIFNNCVPPPVVSAAISGTLSHLSEIRTVTTLFLRLDSYSTSKFNPLSQLQPFFSSMQNCLYECGGMLRQFLIDDKGCVLIGLWGVPTANHPNNCCMAVRCSVMMKNIANSQGEIVSIGITTGSVYTGLIGPEQRRDYVAIGNSVNLSARLMSKACGRILLDISTCQQLPICIRNSLHRINGLELKGIPNNINNNLNMSNMSNKNNTLNNNNLNNVNNTVITTTTTITASTNITNNNNNNNMNNNTKINTNTYYEYDSIVPPSERLRDVREDRMIVIEDYIRKKRDEIVETLDLITSKEPNGLSMEQKLDIESAFLHSEIQSEDSVYSGETKKKKGNLASLNSRVLVIQGTSGSGKTIVINYFLQRLAPKLHYIPPNIFNIKPVISFSPFIFITFISNIDNKPMEAIKMMLEGLLARYDIKNFETILKGYILKAYPELNYDEIGTYIYPYISQLINLQTDWEDDSLSSILSSPEEKRSSKKIRKMSYPVEKIFPRLLSCIIGCEGIEILVLEDVHFICQESWSILIQLCSTEHCPAFIIMSVCNRNIEIKPMVARLNSKPSKEITKAYSTDSVHAAMTLSYASRVMSARSKKLVDRLNTSLQDNRLARGYNIFIELVSPNILQLKSMSLDTISKIILKQDFGELISVDMIDTILDICQGNPSVLWRIINHLKENVHNLNVNGIVSILLDNSLVLSLMKSCHHIHTVVLKTASIIGEEFSISILRKILPESLELIIQDSLDLLVEKGFIILFNDDTYGFSSTLLRKMVYDLIPQSDTYVLHNQIAKVIEDTYTLTTSDDIFSLAYHYSLCDPKDQSCLRLAFNAACECIIKCRDMGDYGMTMTYVDLAETKCSRYHDYYYLTELLKTVIKSASESKSGRSITLTVNTSTTNNLNQYVEEFKSKLQKLNSNTTFTSYIYNYFMTLNTQISLFHKRTRRKSKGHINKIYIKNKTNQYQTSETSEISEKSEKNSVINLLSSFITLYQNRKEKVKVYALG